jgi:Flp pilus assembly protein TadG
VKALQPPRLRSRCLRARPMPPNRKPLPHGQTRRLQAGAAAIELAIVSVVLFTLLFGAMEMARLLWTWNAASEATRLGARLAVVCTIGEANITTRMRQMLPALEAQHVTVAYVPSGCNDTTCQSVRVTLAGYTHQTIIPFAPLSVAIPTFQTTLPREFMQSTGNAVCQL